MSEYGGPRGRAGLNKTAGEQGLRGIGRGNKLDLVESQFMEVKSEKNAQNHASVASKTDDMERLGWAPGVGRGRGIPKQENTRKVKIPSECAGMVIGKAGAKIRELKETSGASINIPSRENRGSEVEVELSGTEEQINKAQDLIEKLTLTGKHKIDDVKDESTAASGGGGATFWGSANYGAPVEDKFEDAEEVEELIDWGAALRECNEAQKLKWSKLPELIKDFYKEHPDVTAMSDEEVRDFRRNNNNIEVKNFKEDDDTPLLKPVTKFHQAFHNYPDIMATINKQGFDKPSPIQCQAWPYLLAGKDCIGIAQTGTGKTLAFLMPAFIHIDSQPTPRGRRGGPNVLVLSPTRELALQIAQEVKKYEYHGIKSVCIYGGGSRKDQCKVVTDGVEIIIATPGRLNDLVEAGVYHLGPYTATIVKRHFTTPGSSPWSPSPTYLVLDEADRMLDMGFEPQIRKVLLDIRPDRQTIMTSATWPENVRRMARSYMNNPVTVFIGSLDLAAVHSVTQRIEKVEEEDKFAYLLDFIRSMDPDDKIIVFVMRKSRCDEIASELAMKYISCQAIHGDREQSDREQALQDLRTGDVKILIATDVASRGIDIEDVTHVLNYDFPRDIEDYVHRVGRTGRAGKTGQALSLWSKKDFQHAPKLVPIMEEAGQEIPDWLAREAVRYPAWKKEKDGRGGGRGGGGGRSGGDGCFRCGESGHFSRECPKGGGGRGGGRVMGSRGRPKW